MKRFEQSFSDTNERRMKVAIAGNLCDTTILFEKLLQSEDMEISTYLSCKELLDSKSSELFGGGGLGLEERVQRLREARPSVHVWDYAPKFARILRCLPGGSALLMLILYLNLVRMLHEANCVVSFAWYHIASLLSRRPYVAFSTGADLQEIAIESSIRGYLMRRAFRKACSVYASYDSTSRANATNIGVTISRPFLMPWPLPERFVSFKVTEGPVRVFMGSRQDWTDPRRAMVAKGNDRFIRAWARRIKDGWKSTLTIVEFGNDIEATRRLVSELEVDEYVRFIPLLNQTALQECVEKADLVADQFDQGTPGVLALQTMATGRALSIYWDLYSSLFAYSVPPPVINGNNDETLYRGLCKCASRQDLQELGRRGHNWMKAHYDRNRIREDLRLSISFATRTTMVR